MLMLELRKFVLVREKEGTGALSPPVLPGRKAYWLDNHVADMLDAICLDDLFARTSRSFNLCLC